MGKVGYGQKVNLGNYETAHVWAEEETGSIAGARDETYRELRAWVQARAKEVRQGVKQG